MRQFFHTINLTMIHRSKFPVQHRNKCYCKSKRDCCDQEFRDGLIKRSSFVKINGCANQCKLNSRSSGECVTLFPRQSYTNQRNKYEIQDNDKYDEGCMPEEIVNVTYEPSRSSLIQDLDVDFNRVAMYRMQNPDECISVLNRKSINSLTGSIYSNLSEHEHVCQFRIRLNERNRPVPILENGNMHCIICGKATSNPIDFTQPLKTSDVSISSEKLSGGQTIQPKNTFSFIIELSNSTNFNSNKGSGKQNAKIKGLHQTSNNSMALKNQRFC